MEFKHNVSLWDKKDAPPNMPVNRGAPCR